MANIAIFRINYKSDFILTLNSDAGWVTPFCIKFWTGAPSQAYFAGYDGETYTHCAPVEGEPTKLVVQFDDHHLPIGDLKFQIGYHFTVADFPTSVEDEVLNQASVIIEVNDAPAQVMLDLNGETAPEIEFSLPAYANEAQRIANEQARIAAEQQRIANEESRIAAEETRQRNEQQRIEQETARVNEFATLKSQSQAATRNANDAATRANQKAQLAADKAALADDAATLAIQKAQLAADKAALANDAAQLAADKAALAQQKAEYAQQQGGYAKDQGDYAKNQGDYAKAQGDIAQSDHERAETDHGIAANDHTQAGNDHTRAETDHGIAANDHTQAGNDHTRAESDHGIAADDHTLAGNDHTRAESDHGIAADDHTLAGNDHTRAESDHTRAESDHAAVEVYVDSLGAFDISAYHATGGVLAKYADLTAALGTNGANIPEALRKGGMSVKFVLSSDNKYMQARLMANSFTTDIGQWQCVDVEPVSNSHNLVESGGVAASQLEEYIDYTGNAEALTQDAGGYWSTDNSYYNSGNYYRYFVKIPQGTTKVKVVYSDLYAADKYAVLFLTELPANIRTSLDSSIIVGSTINIIGENNIQVLNIPNNATYVVLTTRIVLSAGKVMLNTNPFNVFPQKTQFEFGKYLSIDEYIPKGVSGKIIAVNGSVSNDNNYSISNVIKLPSGATLITKNVTNNSNHGIFLSSSEDISEATFTYLTTSTSSPNPKYTNTSDNEQMIVVCRRYVNDNNTAKYSIVYEDKADVVNSPQFIEYTQENKLISENRVSIDMLPFADIGTGTISPNGSYNSSSNWKRYIFRREPWMKYIRVKASTNGLSGNPISYFSKMWVDSSSSQYFIGYNAQIGTNVYTYGVIPDNCNCIFVSTQLTLSTDDAEILVYGDSVEFPLLYDILKQNPRDEVMPRIISARRNLINTSNVLSLIHYSDIHGDAVELKRIMRFHQYYNKYIDDIVDTGDVLGGGWSDPFVVESVPSAGIILRSLGNHDSCVHEGSTYDWWAKTAQECYNRFYAPYISNWNCQYESGKCYFYKDYASNIRLIVIDAMHLDQTQIDWLDTTLSDAKSNSLGVILATHFTYEVVPFNTPFQSLHNQTSIMNNPEGVNYGNVPSSVQSFIDNGGEFICYLSGHTHWDECGTIVNYPEQIQITIDTAYCGYQAAFGDTARAANCKSQDLFNVVTVDTDKKWIKLIRIGANVRSDMAVIDCATIDYANKVLITA